MEEKCCVTPRIKKTCTKDQEWITIIFFLLHWEPLNETALLHLLKQMVRTSAILVPYSDSGTSRTNIISETYAQLFSERHKIMLLWNYFWIWKISKMCPKNPVEHGVPSKHHWSQTPEVGLSSHFPNAVSMRLHWGAYCSPILLGYVLTNLSHSGSQAKLCYGMHGFYSDSFIAGKVTYVKSALS